MKKLVWIILATLIGFVIPFLFGNNRNIPVDIYYLIYLLTVGLLYFFYFKESGMNVMKTFSTNLLLGTVLGLAFALLMAKNVFSRPETTQLTGTVLIWALIWRGVIYGLVDGLFLTVFPWIVLWNAFNVANKPVIKKVGYTLLAWIFTLIITTAYHAGYEDFRSKKLIQPIIGNSIISLSTFISASPVASPIAHAGMHVSAVLHSPETDLFLPPHR